MNKQRFEVILTVMTEMIEDANVRFNADQVKNLSRRIVGTRHIVRLSIIIDVMKKTMTQCDEAGMHEESRQVSMGMDPIVNTLKGSVGKKTTVH